MLGKNITVKQKHCDETKKKKKNKQKKLKGDLKPEHKTTTNRTRMGPPTVTIETICDVP